MSAPSKQDELQEEFASFTELGDTVSVVLNSARLERYLQAIKKKLHQHDFSLQEQIEHVDKLSKEEDVKIARLAVKLDHCLIDINNFKDVVLKRRSQESELDPKGDAASRELYELRSEVALLSAMVRRIDLGQAEGLDSFTQIKQLTSTLKSVTRQLDSLGRNSVILELRKHVDSVAQNLRVELDRMQEESMSEISLLRGSLHSMEHDKVSSLEQRLQLLEEKSILYDLVLNDQGDDQEFDDLNEKADGVAQLADIEDADTFDDSAAVVVATVGADGEPLRPSQMLLLDGPTDSSTSPQPTNLSDKLIIINSNSSFTAIDEVVEEGQEGVAPGEEYTGLDASRYSAYGLIQNLPSTGTAGNRPHRSATANSGQIKAAASLFKGAKGGGRTEGNAGSVVMTKKPIKNAGMNRSSFFSNLMGQYVGREEFASAVQEMNGYTRKAVFRLKQQFQQHAVCLLFTSLVRIHFSVSLWKRERAFALLKSNVSSWHAIRNRRNRAKALMFQARLEKLSIRRIKGMGFRYWARLTYLFRERERLKLWLRAKLQHWINMRIVNVRMYMNRWKRHTVHSYHSSLFAGDQADLEATGISDDFRRLLESDNFNLREVKRIAKEDMKRRWALRDRQERLEKQQEVAVREHVDKITKAITGGDLSILGGSSVKSEELQALRTKTAEVEDSLRQMRLDQRKILNNMEKSAAETDEKIDAEGRRIAAEFNIYRSQVALRFNDAKESLTTFQTEVRAQFEQEQRRLAQLEDRLKTIERRLDNEQSKIAPLVAEQNRMQSLLDAVKGELRVTDTQVDALNGKIERATAASMLTVDTNKRLERMLGENAEYYDVELRFMRTHVSESVTAVAELRAEKQAFVDKITNSLDVMMNDLNNFVERLPPGSELFSICQEYEELWVRLHHEGTGSSVELSTLSDTLHGKVAQVSLRIAHHIATSADRLVLARWTAAFTAKKAIANPQEAPSARNHFFTSSSGVSASEALAAKRGKTLLVSERPETTTKTPAEVSGATLGDGLQVEAVWGTPSVDLVEQVRDELLQSYLATGLIALLRAADEVNGQPGLLKSTGRATFQRKLKRSIEAALTKHPVMIDPAQTRSAATMSLGRATRKHQHVQQPQTGEGLTQRLVAECDACVSCGQNLANCHHATAATFVPPTAGLASNKPHHRPFSGNKKMNQQAKYTYPPALFSDATLATAAELAYGDPATNSHSFADGEGAIVQQPREHSTNQHLDEMERTESPVSQISVSMVRKSPVMFETVATELFPVDTTASATDLKRESVASRPASASTSTAGGASMRHREAVKLSRDQTSYYGGTNGRVMGGEGTNFVNLRSVGRETTVLCANDIARSGSTSALPAARLAAGFDIPVPASAQASTHLADQLASKTAAFREQMCAN